MIFLRSKDTTGWPSPESCPKDVIVDLGDGDVGIAVTEFADGCVGVGFSQLSKSYEIGESTVKTEGCFLDQKSEICKFLFPRVVIKFSGMGSFELLVKTLNSLLDYKLKLDYKKKVNSQECPQAES